MDSKRLALPDQLLAPRRKSFLLWVGASLIMLSLLFLATPFKGRIVTPFVQGFNSVTLNSSLVSWPFSHFPSSRNSTTSSPTNVGVVVLEKTHVGNFSEIRQNGSFGYEQAPALPKSLEGRSGNFTDSGGDGRAFERPHLGIGEIGNASLSSIVDDADAKRSTEGKSVENFIAENKNEGNEEIGKFPGGGGEQGEDNTVSFEKCDIFDGKWVRDDSKPYYPPGSCPYVDKDFDCHLNGRPDDGFVKWKWQPNGCDIPSLNATDFLERLRGKKLVFVGDSLNRNMWESLVCILRNSIRKKKRVYEISGRREFKKKGFYSFRFEDYKCTVDFVSSPFLVRESSFKSRNGTLETLRLDLMDQTTSMYHDADVLVFNTGHWWTHEKTSRGEDYYQEGNYVHQRLKVLEAYKRALLTWARWIDKNIDSNRTMVFFRGYSVTHFRGGLWSSGGQCHKETEPIFNTSYLGKYPSKMRALQHVLQEIKTPIVYLNISRLTAYRKDAHPSIYRMAYKTAEERTAAERSQDCSHWCLPGVPDTWNELLYASMLKVGLGSWKK
ncbi:unnamed protein product [Dovyalis caffra]|uniref:Trichome birefringence-like N-terminal domain-containing protein n=1 Tax=Dovyalis caffra TaxID=77055 RepID=A0AAV1RBZ0_9ROSI|nr:unnamed protein product [Dovyalis caffra]